MKVDTCITWLTALLNCARVERNDVLEKKAFESIKFIGKYVNL